MLAQKRQVAVEQVHETTYMTLTQNVERRKHRRHDLSDQDLPIYAVNDGQPADTALGKLLDISSGGMKFQTRSGAIRPNSRIGVQFSLPSFGGVRAFVDHETEGFTTDWTGFMTVTRVIRQSDGSFEVAGQLMDLSDGERGLLGLYLSTQPLAA